ncbi:MAG TPA: Clp protease N-terminal domain-containing protein [Pseudonocardiaceae bacterium]|nr:Clp protease N-terminal domain-containing protein [Pseudonocardiaceae bacterium]
MSPLNVSLSDLISRVDTDLPEAPALTKITEAQARSHTLTALGDQLVGHYVAQAKEEGASWTEIGDAIGVSKQAAQQRWVPNIFSRYTDLARHAVVLSQESARNYKHKHIGTEHLLLGLLDEPKGLAARVLIAEAGSADAVRQAVEQRMPAPDGKTPRGHIPFTDQGKRSIEQAARQAADLGHDFIGTEHLLLGLLAVADGGAAVALGALGIDLAGARPIVATEVENMLAQPRANTD